MKVPLTWLQEFIDLPTSDVAELSHAFDMLGLTVEGVTTLEPGWSEVYVGEVLEVAPHPDADRIRVCIVDSGTGPSQIICGAWNFDVGARVAVARPGSSLPAGVEIEARTIRGVESNGMILSEAELSLGDDHAGILVLDGEPEVGLPFLDVVELPDVVFEVETTTNRPDVLSILGVARDLAAWFDLKAHVPPVEMPTVPGTTKVGIEIADPGGCRRFTAREVTGVRVARSPLWMRHRLAKVGVRPISNVVDVTNYVMFELGHPLHAFDADTIEGDRLVIKRAEEGQTLVTLDGVERRLHPDDLIIYDDAGPTSMSGTMGGARSEVTESTTRVLMEAASWDPPTIMYMWRRHDLRSEAATRFERGVDPNLADDANQRACALVQRLAGGEILDGAVDEVAVDIGPWVVDLHLRDVTRLLGEGFEAEEVAVILSRLGMTVSGADPLEVTVPTYRPDLTRPADLVEEVARIHGYDRFGATIPTGPAGGLSDEQRRLRLVRQALVGIGLSQSISLPFVAPEDVAALGQDTGALLTVRNPLREQESKLRPSLLPGVLVAVRQNRSRGIADVALFETGKVFRTEPDSEDPRVPLQYERLAWAVTGKVGSRHLSASPQIADGAVSLAIWRFLAEALHVDADLVAASPPGMHPGRTAEVRIGGVVVGHVGELHPATARSFQIDSRVAVAELDLAPLLAQVEPVLAASPSSYPPVDFDLSFLVPDTVSAGALVEATVAGGGRLVESTEVFDVFRDAEMAAGERALAVRYRLRAPDRTLDASEIAGVRARMIESASRLGARLRGVE